MASSFLTPGRRFLYSSTSTRVIASASRSNPSESRLPSSQQYPSANARASQLTNLLDDVSERHDYDQMKRAQFAIKFPLPKDDPIIRPIDFNQQFVRSRPQNNNNRRPPLGPGREARYTDVFLQSSIDPRREADNDDLLSGYLTRLGRIKPRSMTGLSQRSQRILSKAIKRARMMGVIPLFHNPKTIDRTFRSLRASATVDRPTDFQE